MVLIAYASKTGTTAECAAQLAALLPGASLCDLTKETPEIGRFDAVIVGGCIRMGALHKAAAGFLRENAPKLLGKPLGLFTCNGLMDTEMQVLRASVPAELLEHAACIRSFGGRIEPERLHGPDRWIAKLAVAGFGQSMQNEVFPARIEEFAAAFGNTAH